MSGHGEDGPAVPRRPATNLMLVQAGQSLTRWAGLLDRPPAPGHRDEGASTHRSACVAAVEREFTGADRSADQQRMSAGNLGVADVDRRPVVPAVPFRTDACTEPVPGP